MHPSRRAKNVCFSGLGGYRRTSPASSCPLQHGSTRFLRARHLYLLILPATKRVGRGLSLCRDRGSIVARAERKLLCFAFPFAYYTGLLQQYSMQQSGLLFAAQHPHYSYEKKMPRKTLRLPINIITSYCLLYVLRRKSAHFVG